MLEICAASKRQIVWIWFDPRLSDLTRIRRIEATNMIDISIEVSKRLSFQPLQRISLRFTTSRLSLSFMSQCICSVQQLAAQISDVCLLHPPPVEKRGEKQCCDAPGAMGSAFRFSWVSIYSPFVSSRQASLCECTCSATHDHDLQRFRVRLATGACWSLQSGQHEWLLSWSIAADEIRFVTGNRSIR